MKRCHNAGDKRAPSPARKRIKKSSMSGGAFLLGLANMVSIVNASSVDAELPKLDQPTTSRNIPPPNAESTYTPPAKRTSENPAPPRPVYVQAGTFKVGERSFPKRQRVPAGMRTDVPVWAFRVRAPKSRSAVTKYIVFTPMDVEVVTHPHSITHAR